MLHYIQNDIKNSVDLFNTEEIVSSKYVLFIFGWMCEWKAQVEGGVTVFPFYRNEHGDSRK